MGIKCLLRMRGCRECSIWGDRFRHANSHVTSGHLFINIIKIIKITFSVIINDTRTGKKCCVQHKKSVVGNTFSYYGGGKHLNFG